jgi:fatty-acid peroxygenase
LLFGRGAIHGLDGDAHRTRKQLFLGALDPNDVAQCARLAAGHLADALDRHTGGELVTFRELVRAYGRAVIEWAGVGLPASDAVRLSREYARIVDGFGFAGIAYPRAWRARVRTNRWARRYLCDVRAGRTPAGQGTVVRRIADSDLDPHTSAVELGNVLRPTVAVAWLGTFAVLALARIPHWRGLLAAPDAVAERVSFAQEVRRTSPFVPALAGRVQRARVFGELRLEPGNLIVLDVPGINHDPQLHPEPARFRPERFLSHRPGPYDLVPQGGGPLEGHRCPGESMAIQLLAATTEVLAGREYDVVSDPRADLTRIPTLPSEGLRLRL